MLNLKINAHDPTPSAPPLPPQSWRSEVDLIEKLTIEGVINAENTQAIHKINI